MFEMLWNCFVNVLKVFVKCFENVLKICPKYFQNRPHFPKYLGNRPSLIPKSHNDRFFKEPRFPKGRKLPPATICKVHRVVGSMSPANSAISQHLQFRHFMMKSRGIAYVIWNVPVHLMSRPITLVSACLSLRELAGSPLRP